MRHDKMVIESKLSTLLNIQLTNIGRAGNMLWITFGDQVNTTDFRGKPKVVCQYALHISCPWRITCSQKILVASGDFYIPKLGLMDDDHFDWDIQGNNRFDERKKDLLENIKKTPTYVMKIQVNHFGGLKIYFDNNYVLEIFPDSSLEEEYWRFIENQSNNEMNKHFVVFEGN